MTLATVTDGGTGARACTTNETETTTHASLMRDLDLPRGEERELVAIRGRVYELDGGDSRTLAAVGAFRVVPEHDLDIDHDTLDHLLDEGLVETVDLGDDERGLTLTREGRYLPARPRDGQARSRAASHEMPLRKRAAGARLEVPLEARGGRLATELDRREQFPWPIGHGVLRPSGVVDSQSLRHVGGQANVVPLRLGDAL
jgi:hypothetical protein